jgi:hypothetical protein
LGEAVVQGSEEIGYVVLLISYLYCLIVPQRFFGHRLKHPIKVGLCI